MVTPARHSTWNLTRCPPKRSDEDRCCIRALDIACACGVAQPGTRQVSELGIAWLAERVAKPMQEMEAPSGRHTQQAILCVETLMHTLTPVKYSYAIYQIE